MNPAEIPPRLFSPENASADPLAALLQLLPVLTAPLSITIRRPGLLLSLDVSDKSTDVPAVAPAVSPAVIAALPEIQANILEALDGHHLNARQLADRAGYRLISHFRTALATMRRVGLLHHDDVGYFKPT
jgi:hypothetical protein